MSNLEDLIFSSELSEGLKLDLIQRVIDMTSKDSVTDNLFFNSSESEDYLYILENLPRVGVFKEIKKDFWKRLSTLDESLICEVSDEYIRRAALGALQKREKEAEKQSRENKPIGIAGIDRTYDRANKAYNALVYTDKYRESLKKKPEVAAAQPATKTPEPPKATATAQPTAPKQEKEHITRADLESAVKTINKISQPTQPKETKAKVEPVKTEPAATVQPKKAKTENKPVKAEAQPAAKASEPTKPVKQGKNKPQGSEGKQLKLNTGEVTSDVKTGVGNEKVKDETLKTKTPKTPKNSSPKNDGAATATAVKPEVKTEEETETTVKTPAKKKASKKNKAEEVETIVTTPAKEEKPQEDTKKSDNSEVDDDKRREALRWKLEQKNTLKNNKDALARKRERLNSILTQPSYSTEEANTLRDDIKRLEKTIADAEKSK